MKNKKILILVTQLEPAGAQKAASILSKMLTTIGIQNNLVFLYEKTKFDYLQVNDIDFEIISKKNKASLFDIPVYIKEISRLNPEVILAFTHYAIVIALIQKLINPQIKIIANHRNPRYSYPLIARIFLSITRKLVFLNTFVSEDTKNSFFPLQGRTIINPIGFTKKIKSKEFSIPESKFLLCVGRLSDQKNYFEVLEEMIKYKGEIKLKIVGDGPLKKDIISFIKEFDLNEKVELLGIQTHDQIIELLKNTSCFLMPSKFEGTSNSLIEALYYAPRVAINNIPSLIETSFYLGKNYSLIKGIDFNNWIELFNNLESGNIQPKENSIREKFDNQTFLKNFVEIIEKC